MTFASDDNAYRWDMHLDFMSRKRARYTLTNQHGDQQTGILTHIKTAPYWNPGGTIVNGYLGGSTGTTSNVFNNIDHPSFSYVIGTETSSDDLASD